MSPDLVEAFVAHLDRLRRAGHPTGPGATTCSRTPAAGGSAASASAEIVREAAALATERARRAGLPPLPNTTPHTLRRTYISIALLANRFDVKWVMSQVGHADSKMTMDVYAQLEQRVKREHGGRFDALVREAGARASTALDPAEDAEREIGAHGLGHRGALRSARSDGAGATRDRRRTRRSLLNAGLSEDGETRTRTGDTTIFSRVLYQLSYLAAAAKG